MKTMFWAALAALTIGSAVSAADRTVPVDGDFNDGEISWTGGHSKSYIYVWDIIAVDGRIAVCGAGQFTDASTRSASRDILRKSKVTVGGRTILKDLTFFTQVKKSANLSSATATCRVTEAPVPKGDQDIYLEMAGGRAHF